MSSRLAIVEASDFHLGHQKVPAEYIYYNALAYLLPKLEDCQIFYSGGDFFHTLLNIDHLGAHYAIRLMSDILNVAVERNIQLRILRGTFSHDRHQNAIFRTMAAKRPGAEHLLTCVDTLSLEYFTQFDLRVLYIPDNLPYRKSEDCLVVIRQMLADMQWDAVDLVIGHGYFAHVIPPGCPHTPPCTFRAEQFKDIVRGAVLMGHVHTYSWYCPWESGPPIIYGGSFDRTAHGEEEAKGFLTGVREDDRWKFEFVINRDAMPFLTIRPRDTTREEQLAYCLAYLQKKLPRPEVGHIRIIHEDAAARSELCAALAVHYPQIHFTHTSSRQATTTVRLLEEPQFDVDEEVVPTEANLPELLYQHILRTEARPTLSQADIEVLLNAR